MSKSDQSYFNKKTGKVEKRGWISNDTYDKMKVKLDKSRASLEAISKIGVKMDTLNLKSRISEKNWRSWNLNDDYKRRKTDISAYRLELPPIIPVISK